MPADEIRPDEMRPDDRRSGVGHADGGTEPRVCCGNRGPDLRSVAGGDEGRDPRSVGSALDERVPCGCGDDRGSGDGRGSGLRGDDESFDRGRGGSSGPVPEPLRRDDESSLTPSFPLART